MIYIFGNSHANTFTRTSPGLTNTWVSDQKFSSFSLGPIIAYNFKDNHYPRVLSLLKDMSLKSDDYIVFAVGEVDHRWHLPKKSAVTGISIDDVTKECVDRFFETFVDLKKRGYNVIGWGSHPSTTGSHNEDMNQPVFGDCLTRNQIGRIWNNRLESLCLNNNIPFVSLFEDLIEPSGMTKMDYYMDYCHLDPNKIRQLLERKFEKFY